jgi:hypothetical protein
VNETMIQEGLEWNDSVIQLAAFFDKQGFDVVAISRVPYISQGDVVQDYYVLDTCLFVLKIKRLPEVDSEPKDQQVVKQEEIQVEQPSDRHEEKHE